MKFRIITSIAGLGLLIPALAVFKKLKQKKMNVELNFIEDFITAKWDKRIFDHYEYLAKNHLILTKFISKHYRVFANITFEIIWMELKRNRSKQLKKINNETCIVFHGYASKLISKINKEFKYNNRIIEMHTNWGLTPHWPRKKNKFVNKFGPFKINNINIAGIPVETVRHNNKKNKNMILLMGGGWGIGKLFDIVKILLSNEFNVRIAIGDNFLLGQKIFNNFYKDFKNKKIEIYSLIQPSRKMIDYYRKNNNFLYNKFYPKLVKWDSDIYSKLNSGKHNYFSMIDKYPPFYYLSKNINCIITKPGGITLYEAAMLNLKIFMLPPLNMQENINYKFWIKNKGAEIFNINRLKEFNRLKSNSKTLCRLVPEKFLDRFIKFIIKEA